MTNSKNVLAPILAALLAGTTLAGAQAQNRAATPQAPGTQAQQPPQRFERPARGPLTVKYYNGNPLQGGKLVSTMTVQPQPGSAANPFANAPKGATHVAVSTPFGTRITTVKDARAQPFGGRHDGGLRGGRFDGQNNPNGQNGRGAPPAGAAQANPGQGGRMGDNSPGDRNGSGLRLPGLRDASRVTFYAADPLAGGQAQTTIQLNGAPTAQQQQAIKQAAGKAKFAVIERAGETMVVNLSALPGGVLGTAR